MFEMIVANSQKFSELIPFILQDKLTYVQNTKMNDFRLDNMYERLEP